MSIIEIPLTRGLVTLVDEADAERVMATGKWYALRGRHTFYAARNGVGMLHRLLFPTWRLVDHINGDGLDNRRSNLREATHAQNMRNSVMHHDNTTGFRGVSVDRRNGRFRAHIRVEGRSRFLGSFATAPEAARAYDAAASEFSGEFARLNFPTEVSA